MFNPITDFLTLFIIILVGLFVWGAFSPFEALGWWAGWFGERIYVDARPSDGHIRIAQPNAQAYILFLSGIGRVSGETFSLREQGFLQRLAESIPQSVIIDDIFPYSVNNLALTMQPFLARFWQWVLRRKLDGPKLAGYLINIRNIWQVCISADNRYGPIYNQAVAEVLLHSLLRYDYDLADQRPVFIIGYSGAGQMAVASVSYLRELIQAPIYVISLGGIFSSEPGLLVANHVYHLSGSFDYSHRLGLLAPGRWPLFSSSEWNRARRQGLITQINIGPMRHTGAGGYLDIKSFLPDGTSFMDHTVHTVADIVRRHTDWTDEQRVNPPAQPPLEGNAERENQQKPLADAVV